MIKRLLPFLLLLFTTPAWATLPTVDIYLPLQDNAASTALVDSGALDVTAVLQGGDNTSAKSNTGGPGGPYQRYLLLNGSDDWGDTGIGSTSYAASNYTITCWFNHTSGSEGVISVPTTTASRLSVQVSSGTYLLACGGGTPTTLAGPAPSGGWEHLAVVVDRTNTDIHFYVNGTLIGSMDGQPATGAGSSNWFFGSVYSGAVKALFSDGGYAGYRVYGSALSGAQVLEDMQLARPQATTSPSFTGIPQDGHVLTGALPTWTDGSHVAYVWQEADDLAGTNAANISGATALTYTVDEDVVQEDHYVRFGESQSNTSGTTTAYGAWTRIGPSLDKYYYPGTVKVLKEPTAQMVIDGTPGWYYSVIVDTPVTINNVQYYRMFASSDHGGTADSSTGVYLFFCRVGDDPTVGANWIAANAMSPSIGLSHPFLDNTTSGTANGPETPAILIINGVTHLYIHEDQGANQRSVLYTSTNGYNGWVDEGDVFPQTAEGFTSSHNGYGDVSVNRALTAYPYKYVGWTLFTGPTSGSSLRNFNQLMGSNDGETWEHIRLSLNGSSPKLYDAYQSAPTMRPLPITSSLDSIRKVSNGDMVGLVAIEENASGDAPHLADLVEMAVSDTGEYTSQPRQLLVHTAGTVYANEISQVKTCTLNGQLYGVGVASNASDVARIVIFELDFNPDAKPLDPYPFRNHNGDVDFTEVTELPTDWHFNGTGSYAITEDGLELTTTGKYFLVGPPIYARYPDVMEFSLEGVTYDHTNIGFQIGFVDGDASSIWDDFADGDDSVSIYANTDGRGRLLEDASGTQTTTITDYQFGADSNDSCDIPNTIGLKFWPKVQAASFLAIDRNPEETVTLTNSMDVARNWIPCILWQATSGTKTLTIPRIKLRYSGADASTDDPILGPRNLSAFGN